MKSKAYSNKLERQKKQREKIYIIILKIFFYFSRIYYNKLPLDDLCFIIFYINRSKILRRSIKRIYQILLNIKEIVILQLLLLFLVAYLLFILTYGKTHLLKIEILDFGDTYFDTKYYYSFNYSNFFTIFISLLFLQTTNNHPDCFLFHRERMYTIYPIIIFNCLVNVFLVQNVLLAFIDQKYQESWIKDLEDLRNHENVMK